MSLPKLNAMLSEVFNPKQVRKTSRSAKYRITWPDGRSCVCSRPGRFWSWIDINGNKAESSHLSSVKDEVDAAGGTFEKIAQGLD